GSGAAVTPHAASAVTPHAASAVTPHAASAVTPRPALPSGLPATTPATGHPRSAAALTAGGLKRPRVAAEMGVGAGAGGGGGLPTHGSRRPPRPGSAPAAAGGSNKRKFVSPVPAGYK
ncbi:hypothetical protein Agub_g11978, partial [Astrephomene gubernaculifera]